MEKSNLELSAEYQSSIEAIGKFVAKEFIYISKIPVSKRYKYQRMYLRVLREILRHSGVKKVGDFIVKK